MHRSCQTRDLRIDGTTEVDHFAARAAQLSHNCLRHFTKTGATTLGRYKLRTIGASIACMLIFVACRQWAALVEPPCGQTSDCTSGKVCVMSKCRPACSNDASCSNGDVCRQGGCVDPKSLVCSPPCPSGQACVAGECKCNADSCSGCCENNICRTPSKATCGVGGVTCQACPEGLSCEKGECIVSCDPVKCGNGCCTQTGCESGMTTGACGSRVQCFSCDGSPDGSRCRDQKCGCNAETDCPSNNACQPTGKCGASCQNGLKCQGGCCNGTTCVAGDSPTACGGNGSICTDCSTDSLGHACVNGQCGCNGDGDCSNGTTCINNNCVNADQATCASGKCEGCCQDNLCLQGRTNNACGKDNNECARCADDDETPICMNGTSCGCGSTNDCPLYTICVGPSPGHCSTTGCDNNNPCNGGCCRDGTCVPGTTIANCGNNGYECWDCFDYGYYCHFHDVWDGYVNCNHHTACLPVSDGGYCFYECTAAACP